jgi:hypothetical protein
VLKLYIWEKRVLFESDAQEQSRFNAATPNDSFSRFAVIYTLRSIRYFGLFSHLRRAGHEGPVRET